ncbi:acid protease [Rhizopogon vinicolor AM-OR11-026]|uniref:Acid protease n=1 Tax=Rhizopogon vinicolor AM-OR11-026 TaxID=1314800 RepID=A0A1B7NFS0_9AGAM|nr:acid protease [Rhizopogon vinicolor AM-OR11-026]
MVLSKSLASFLFPVLALLLQLARASPRPPASPSTATLKLTLRVNSVESSNTTIAARARARALLQRSGSSSISAANYDGAYHSADVGVGNPPTYYTLLVDTGSSNTWIGASKSYQKTSTSEDTGDQFEIEYGTAAEPSPVYGEEYLDTVTLNSDLSIEKQSIGVAASGSTANLPPFFDGIFGLGPVDLTEGVVKNTYQVPTAMNNLYAQKTINSEVLGMFFSPVSSGDTTGELTFGGYDASKITGGVNYAPITSTYPASAFWGIDQSISYGNTTILSKTAGIVDSGTPTIPIASDAFKIYQSATGGIMDDANGMLTITSDQYDKLSSLYFNIGGVSYELTSNAQIWPRSLNTAIGGSADAIYLIVTDIGSDSGSGLDFINGHCFLERFYAVFDTTNFRVGFATTQYTDATTN